jgi:undecaprenyldiphospho-muramoylpentapeptide beta-N-acetylglucosaminyltransferase
VRLLICAGGTGGGVYPALAVLQALQQEADQGLDLQVLWVGSEGGMEADLVQRNHIPYTTIRAAGVHGVGWRTLPRNLWLLSQGLVASRRILQQFKPDLLLFTGGYVAVPMALAGHSVPSLLFVPDIEPGLALKVLGRFASRIGLIAEESRKYFPIQSQVSVSGYPVRSDLVKYDKPAARRTLNLNPNLTVLLVTGGSKGARSINRAVLNILPDLPEAVQVLHLTGELDWPAIQSALKAMPASVASRYHPQPYLHDMGAALAAADLVVSRAGASTLGEYPTFGLPSVLVPYPYAWRYQKVNADFLVQRGAAMMVSDQNLAAQLLPTLQGLLNDPEKLQAMSSAMRSLARPDAARDLASLSHELASSPKSSSSKRRK